MSTTKDDVKEIVDYQKKLEDENIRIANSISMERSIRIDKTARKLLSNNGVVDIRLRIPEGEIVNPFGEKEVTYKEGEYETKQYRFKKIATSDWNLYMMKRAEMQTEMVKTADQADQRKIADLSNRIYEYLALKYLGVPHKDYVRAEYDDMKLAIEACNHITENANHSFDYEDSSETIPHLEEVGLIEKIMTNPPQYEDFTEDTKRLNKRTIPETKEGDSSRKKTYEYDG